jgi:hypothetical protein
MLATPGTAVELKFDLGSHRQCDAATTDPSGEVALGIFGAAPDVGTLFNLYTPAGNQVGTTTGPIDANRISGSADLDEWFHPVSGGWRGVVHDQTEDRPPEMLRTWNATGATTSDLRHFTRATAADGKGGSVVLASTFDDSSTTPLGPPLLEWVDASGAVTQSVTLDDNPSLVVVNWATGHVVAVVTGSPGRARWFDGAGAPLTPWFGVGAKVTGTSLHSLSDGTVVLSDGSAWTVALSDGVAHAVAVPGWLASRPGTRLATVRSGRGFAVLPFAAPAGGDQTKLEIVANDGTSCGTVTIPAVPPTATESENPQRLDIGWDGTLFQMSNRSVANDPQVHCSFRWWAGLLK